MAKTKILGTKRAGKVPQVLPQRGANGRFLTGRPIKALSGQQGKILGNSRGKILGQRKGRS